MFPVYFWYRKQHDFECTLMLIGISKFFKDNKVALVSCYMKNALIFSQSDSVIFSCILIQAGRVWNFGPSYRRIHTDPASSNKIGKWEVCRHAKRQKWKRKHSITSRVSSDISFVLQLLPAALQQNKASRLLYLLTSLIWYWKGAIHAWNYCHLKYLLFSTK